ncbi:uncharacterized protein LOC128724084 [Anopheles nili]|uniref:uncharacterized protein LOC128724084 n=1 Tax=Anopheles nili TaxID=185578 RepID=UPI00237C4918|nr:uncharacterized protein LOC128724084 [Anopheles nili]
MQLVKQQALLVGLLSIFTSCTNGDRTFMAFMDSIVAENRIELAMMPNVRESLDDCHMRYYKYDEEVNEYPMFERARLVHREYPHLALLGWTQPNGTIVWGCVGALVWENFILTTARCIGSRGLAAPDVARMGDSEPLGNENVNQHVQQLKIVQAVRHPEYRAGEGQHDVALVRLEQHVRLHSTVVPACLWNRNDFNHTSLEAIGWNTSGSPKLSKVTVHPVSCDQSVASQNTCFNNDGSDRCLGGSSGFVQARLHHNSKVSPFLLAFTATTSGQCDGSTPAVYTPVSSYIKWIQETIVASGERVLDWELPPDACALRYVHLREYDSDVVIGETSNSQTVTPGRSRIKLEQTYPMAEIRYGGYYVSREDCNGIVIDEDTVLTLAQCTTNYGKLAAYVNWRNERNTVVKHYNHPGYREGEHHNDIGILKVEMPFVFSRRFVPSCIWYEPDLPGDEILVSGYGRRDLNYFSLHSETVTVFEPSEDRLVVRSNVLPLANCSYPEEFQKGLPRGLTEENICFGHDTYLVPKICQQAYGGPIGGKVARLDRTFQYAYGLNSFGRDCGFGRAAVGVKLSHHAHWLKTILLADYRTDTGSLLFLHSELEMNDTCRHVDGSDGRCIDATRCPRIRYEFSNHRQVVFCNSPTVVCCPYENMVNETTAAGRELDECVERYGEARSRSINHLYQNGPSSDEFPHLVMIGWKSTKEDAAPRWKCRGTIIASRAIVTVGTCLLAETGSPTAVRLGMNNDAAVVAIEEVIFHPDRNGSSGIHDVAVIKLNSSIEQTSSSVYPACIWSNQTHTPFEMIQLVINETADEYVYSMAKYNADCNPPEADDRPEDRLRSSQLCVDVSSPNTVVSRGDGMFWSRAHEDGTSIQYLVGLMSHRLRHDPSINVHIRMSSYVGWIKSIL